MKSLQEELHHSCQNPTENLHHATENKPCWLWLALFESQCIKSKVSTADL